MFRKLTLFFILLLVFFFSPRIASGFGVTPAEINVKNLKAGSHYETEIFVTRPAKEVSENLNVVLEPDLGEMGSWFKFEPGMEFPFPKGENTTKFKVIIDVPKDIDLKTYKGSIVAKGLSDKKASEGVTMIKGAVLQVELTTTNKDLSSLKVLSINAPSIESGDPVSLFIKIENLGNTPAKPDRVDLEIMDLFEKPLESLSDSSFEVVEPFTTKEIKAEFNSNLDVGQYRIDASVVFKGEEIARQKMVLTVNAKPAKVKEEIFQVQPVSFGLMNWIGLILAFVGLLILTILLFVYFRRKEKGESDFEKKISDLVHKNKLLTLLLLVASFLITFVGLVLGFSPKLIRQNKVVESEVVEKEKILSPTLSPSPTTQVQITPTPQKEVKGVSVQLEEKNAPFLVSKPGTPGLYPVYEKPTFTSKIIYEAEDGETFEVIKKEGDWYNIMLYDGSFGWLHKTSVKSRK